MKNRFSRCRLGLAAVIVLAGFCATPVRAGALRPTAGRRIEGALVAAPG